MHFSLNLKITPTDVDNVDNFVNNPIFRSYFSSIIHTLQLLPNLLYFQIFSSNLTNDPSFIFPDFSPFSSILLHISSPFYKIRHERMFCRVRVLNQFILCAVPDLPAAYFPGIA